MARENLGQNMEQWKNLEHNKFLEWVKKTLWALAATLTIAQWINAKEINLGNIKNLQEVKQICSKVAGDVDNNVYSLQIPEGMYVKNRSKIMYNFPENEWCRFLVAKKDEWNKVFNVLYWNAFWDFDIKFYVKQEQKEAEQMEKMLKAEWYLQDKVILIWKNVDNREFILDTLNEILKNLKIRNLKWNEYWEQAWRVLKQVRKIYEIKWDNIIPKKIGNLLRKLNLD